MSFKNRIRSLDVQAGAQERGFVLLEALVAILIFSFGVLGLVGLQASMMREQTASKFRSDAAYLASELTGLIWSDVANIASYNGSNCASYTLCKDWASKVAASLPHNASTVTSAVTTNAGTGDVTIEIKWAMPGNEEHKYTMNTTVVATDKP